MMASFCEQSKPQMAVTFTVVILHISPGLCSDCGLFSVFDTAPAAGAGSRTTADIPNGLIPFNFSVFLLLPDPDHILPHCGEGNILQWVEKFCPNCWESREAGCKL